MQKMVRMQTEQYENFSEKKKQRPKSKAPKESNGESISHQLDLPDRIC